jgi:hypothetical protein
MTNRSSDPESRPTPLDYETPKPRERNGWATAAVWVALLALLFSPDVRSGKPRGQSDFSMSLPACIVAAVSIALAVRGIREARKKQGVGFGRSAVAMAISAVAAVVAILQQLRF